jgi:2-keto-4-pentenoate hydratase/2-oxohepta-3-ene-1,7-dioic acid hydratase in catechol pathway
MKFATIQYNGRQTVAVVDPEAGHAWPIDAALGEPVDGMLDLIRRFDEIKGRIKLDGQPVSLAEVRIEAPIPRPFRNILCVGKNYHEHAHEFTRSGFDAGAKVEDAIPKKPIIFTKPPETVIADGDPIRYPHGVSDSIDYEAELGVVIGKGGRGISKADAYSHVLGYTIINDMTARDLQSEHKQWFLGKSLDTFCPMGPWLVTADEVGDPQTLAIRSYVNGELMQDANTADMIFGVAELVSFCSQAFTLEPGDVIATGTPSGVGWFREPKKLLKDGDEIVVEIDRIGRLVNSCRVENR